VAPLAPLGVPGRCSRRQHQSNRRHLFQIVEVVLTAGGVLAGDVAGDRQVSDDQLLAQPLG
jgi:hypothetical protein